MADSQQTVRALYKDGALHPLDPLDLPDNYVVEVTVAPEGAKETLDALLKRVQSRFKDIAPVEIERDIIETIREARKP